RGGGGRGHRRRGGDLQAPLDGDRGVVPVRRQGDQRRSVLTRAPVRTEGVFPRGGGALRRALGLRRGVDPGLGDGGGRAGESGRTPKATVRGVRMNFRPTSLAALAAVPLVLAGCAGGGGQGAAPQPAPKPPAPSAEAVAWAGGMCDLVTGFSESQEN